jgi:ubiquitin-protein ligase E3 C
VDNASVVRFVHLLAHYRLNVALQRECHAFFQGLSELIQPDWIRIFSVPELSILLSGVSRPIDIEDLRAHTVYSDTYDDDHPTIQALWRVLHRFGPQDRRMFVRFVTSVERPPLLGFRELRPAFCIRQAGADEERLPTASTCVNLLKLPPYSREEVLERKLRYAIQQAATDGFHLS